MKLKRIEHVGVAVRAAEGSRRLREDCLGIELAQRPAEGCGYGG